MSGDDYYSKITISRRLWLKALGVSTGVTTLESETTSASVDGYGEGGYGEGSFPVGTHPSGVSQEVWSAVTGQHEPTDKLTFDDLTDAIQSYREEEPVNGVELTFQDLVDLINWYHR